MYYRTSPYPNATDCAYAYIHTRARTTTQRAAVPQDWLAWPCNVSVCLSDCLSVCLSCELQLPLGRFRSRGRSSTDPTQLDLRVDEDGGAILSGAWSPRAEVDGGGLTGAKCGGFMELDLATDFAPSPKGRQVTW